MNRIRKGDQVIVIAGSDKGKKGEVVRIAGDKVVVQNINIIKRHTKANPQTGQAAVSSSARLPFTCPTSCC